MVKIVFKLYDTTLSNNNTRLRVLIFLTKSDAQLNMVYGWWCKKESGPCSLF